MSGVGGLGRVRVSCGRGWRALASRDGERAASATAPAKTKPSESDDVTSVEIGKMLKYALVRESSIGSSTGLPNRGALKVEHELIG